jgi:hypothetical protein
VASIVKSQAKQRLVENWIIVPLAIAASGAMFYWAMVLDRVPPIIMSEGEIIPAKVKGGEPITARWRIDKTRDVSYSQQCTRDIIDSLGHFRRVDEQERAGVMPPLENNISRSVIVHFDAAWGKAYYRQQCCYEIEGLSLTRMFPICVRRPELPFEILPNK